MSLRRAVRKAVPPSLLRGQSLARAAAAQTASGFPGRKLNVIGVTGTDGKSTTCFIIASLLRLSGKKTALLSTIAIDLADGQGLRPSPKHMTTAGNWQLARLVNSVKQNRPDWLVMEVSSHALDQNRVWGIPFSLAVMTNLSHEHLDYHDSMERYAAAKARLFTLVNRNKRGLGAGIINADDAYSQAFIKASAKPITYGLKHGDWRAKQVQADANGLSFLAVRGGEQIKVRSQLLGEFNVYNLLAAIATAREIGLTPADIEKNVPKIEPVPGRMMKLDLKAPFNVIIDYAVTPNALEKALNSAGTLAGKGRVILVFGATGDRDKAKRPVMGEVAEKGADKIFLTDDETYREEPAKIRQAVFEGVKQAGGASKCEIIDDRQKAIQAALGTARAGDVVLITGLGHQTSRNVGGHDQPWSDEQVVRKIVKGL